MMLKVFLSTTLENTANEARKRKSFQNGNQQKTFDRLSFNNRLYFEWL